MYRNEILFRSNPMAVETEEINEVIEEEIKKKYIDKKKYRKNK